MYKAQYKAGTTDKNTTKKGIKLNVKMNAKEEYTYTFPNDLTIDHKRICEELNHIFSSRKIKTLYELIDYFNDCCYIGDDDCSLIYV
jgi:hypothetical protein